MKRILILFILIIILLAIAANGQGTQIRNLPAASSVNSGDMFPGDAFAGGTYKYTFGQLLGARTITCTAPLLCAGGASMDLSADRTLSIAGPNVKTINVACTGGGVADTTNRDAALATLQSAGGGVLHFSGSCNFTTSLIQDTSASASAPLIIEGDGRRETSLSFTSACAGGAGTDCIYLACHTGMATDCDGWGIRNLIISGPAGKTLVHLKGLQGVQVSNAYLSGGDYSMSVEEGRFGTIKDSFFWNPAVQALKIVGESYASNWFQNIEISTTGSSGGAVGYVKTGTTDAGGVYFDHVVINGQWGGSGFLFSASSRHSVFVFCDSCVADGNFAQDAFRFVNIGVISLRGSYGTNQYAASNATGLTLDHVQSAYIDGGEFYVDTGSSGPAISIKNTVSRVRIRTAATSIGYDCVAYDGTNHDVSVDIFPCTASAFSNAPQQNLPLTRRYTTPPTYITNATTPTMLGLLDPVGTNSVYLDADSSGTFRFYKTDGVTAMQTLTQSGNVTFAGTVAGSNLSGTNTGDQVVPVNTTATGSNWFSAYNSTTGAYTKSQPAMADLSDAATWKGWTKSGTTVSITTSTDKVGIGTAAPNASLSVSANTANLPAILTGTLVQSGQIDGTANRYGMYAFAAANSFDFVRADTTAASPSALQTNDLIGQITGSGYDGTSYPSATNIAIQYKAAATWTNSSRPTFVGFVTTPVGTTTSVESLRLDSAGHLLSLGTAPTVACTGTGTSPSAPTIDSGGTDLRFTVTVNTGTGSPGSTGTCTLTFATAFSAARPIVCMLVKGATAWGNTSQVQETTESASAPVFTWTNSVGGVATGLTVSTSYKFSCITIG